MGVYTRDWDPQDYAGSQGHTLTVRVTMMDDFGESSSKELSQKFVVESRGLHTLQYSLYARLLLMTDVYTVLQFCWVMACLFCLVPPVMARFSPGKLTEVMSPQMVLRMRLFCSNDYLFYMYVFTGLYVTFGPWHVGEILTGHVG